MTDTPTERGAESTWTRLRRRKVVQWGLAYAAGAWVLLQVLGFAADAFAWPAITKQLAMLGLAVGLPIVVALAWFHGDRGQQRVTHPELAVLTLLLFLGGGLLWLYAQRSVLTTTTATPDKPAQPSAAADTRSSIAVLPFENRSRQEDDEYFVDGIHDDTLTQLSKVSALKVISRTSVEQFRDTKLPMKAIADQLGVTRILEGGVQRAGDRVRINVQLIDAGTDAHLWAESYDRELTANNIFAIRDRLVDCARAADDSDAAGARAAGSRPHTQPRGVEGLPAGASPSRTAKLRGPRGSRSLLSEGDRPRPQFRARVRGIGRDLTGAAVLQRRTTRRSHVAGGHGVGEGAGSGRKPGGRARDRRRAGRREEGIRARGSRISQGDRARSQLRDGALVVRSPPDAFGTLRPLRLLRDADVRAGRPGRARARYAAAYPELVSPGVPTLDNASLIAAVDLAMVLQQTGELARAELLLNRSREFIRLLGPGVVGGVFYVEQGFAVADARIAALRGRPAEALAALRQTERKGWRAGWRYYRDHDPAFAAIRGDAEFKAIFADIERDIARQRATLAARPKDAPLDLRATGT